MSEIKKEQTIDETGRGGSAMKWNENNPLYCITLAVGALIALAILFPGLLKLANWSAESLWHL